MKSKGNRKSKRFLKSRQLRTNSQTHNQTKMHHVISPQPRLRAHSTPETAQFRFKSTRVFLRYELSSALTTTQWFATHPSPTTKP